MVPIYRGRDSEDFLFMKNLVFHPSFQYFANYFGLNMFALEEHGKEATAKSLANMVDFAKNHNIKAVFYQAEA